MNATGQRVEDAARILELEYEVASLENFLQNHSDTEGIRELRHLIEEKNSLIQRLEYTVTEFEDFLKENPDIRNLRALKHELSERDCRIVELENWIERNDDIVVEKTRIIQLEEMITNLENYVKCQDIDGLREKLRDREERVKNLEKIVEKTMIRDNLAIDENIDENFVDIGTREKKEIFHKNEKILQLEKTIVERDEKIHEYQERVTELRREMMIMASEIAVYEAQDIDVLKEVIRVRDERIVMLEEEIDSLERAFSERIDLEQIDELVNVIKDKEIKEKRLENDLENERERKEELTEALRGSVVITSESENKLRRVQIAKRNALERVGKLEQRIASMQTACALKCQTCRPLLSQLQKSEKKLQRLANERRSQLRDHRQIKREALRAALSEKDAQLALLELSGLKTSTQIDQADKLRADKSRLLEKLKQEDKQCIEQSDESDDSSSTASTGLLTKILEPPLARDEDCDFENFDDEEKESEREKSNPDQNNGHASNDGSMMKQIRR